VSAGPTPAIPTRSACAARRDAQNLSKRLRSRNLSKEISNPNSNPASREINMRYLLIIASALFAFGITMTFESTEANAAVCAKGVYRAGCAGARGAVVVRKPVAVACRWVWVGGVKVRRCV
jgi:hypothetical protein